MAEAAEFWDAEFRQGRWADAAPIAFTAEIASAARAAGISSGLYVGCGNGRNYQALVRAGLDLVGLDISPVAIAQLAQRMPERRPRLLVGDLAALPPDTTYDLVVAIQVLHHGDRAAAHLLLADTVARVAPGGMLAIGIETVGTDVDERHEVLERAPDGSYTVRYLDGPGLTVHFRTVRGVHVDLADAGLVPQVLLHPRSAWRQPPERGQTLELEGIYRRPA
jgi:SAM-dependent methyltransferase